MKMKYISIFVVILLFSAIIPIGVFAGDEENPEIIDKNGDARGFVDIISAWFYESSENPEYLIVSLKINNLQGSFFGGGYEVLWTFNDIRYAVHGEIDSILPFEIGWKCGEYKRGSSFDLMDMADCKATYDRETGIITWEVPKNEIGNPGSGDILTKTYAKSCLEIVSFFKILIFIPGLVDHAADIEGHRYGIDYEVKY
jgi:hypothetical protein